MRNSAGFQTAADPVEDRKVIREEEGKRLVAGTGSGLVGMERVSFEGIAVVGEGIAAVAEGDIVAAAAEKRIVQEQVVVAGIEEQLV